jgi:hypothetical protein
MAYPEHVKTAWRRQGGERETHFAPIRDIGCALCLRPERSPSVKQRQSPSEVPAAYRCAGICLFYHRAEARS